MPGGMDGRQLAGEVRARRPATRIVLISGYADEAAAATASDLPVLAKPFDRQDLARALHHPHRETP